MGRRKFTPEFKLEAVKLVTERGMAVRQGRGIWVCTRTCCVSG